MEFSHERATKLSKGNNGNPRGRKEKYYDILRHPRSYKLRAHKCHMRNKRDQHRRFRKEAKERRQ